MTFAVDAHVQRVRVALGAGDDGAGLLRVELVALGDAVEGARVLSLTCASEGVQIEIQNYINRKLFEVIREFFDLKSSF